jgi:hypothetical protein
VDRELVLWLPPPLPGTPTIDPASQQQVDECSNDLLSPIRISTSCPANPLVYQQEAVAAISKQADTDTATLTAARGQVASLLACLVSPTGWAVEVAWTDQATPATFTPAVCATPLAQRLSPIAPPTTTGAP